MRSAILLFLALPLLALPLLAGDEPQIELRPVATLLELPVAITHAGDSRLFITLQRGRVMVLEGGVVRETPFLDITSRVSCCGERGLLSVAFHPRYAENGFFFVYYTDVVGDLVIARYSVSADPNRADPASRVPILTIEHRQFGNHNGGQLQFGPDGFLYIGTGDGGGCGDPFNAGQSLNTLLGKMLRIDVDSGALYAVPPSNPFVSTSGARPEIWAWGLRNPWRFSFDSVTGDLWIADVGQAVVEEVNFQPATSPGGENYGWRRMEGSRCFVPPVSGCGPLPPSCNDGSLTLPVLEYGHADGCSVAGGYRYRGTSNVRLRGSYLYGDYCSGQIWAGRQAFDGSWTSSLLVDTPLMISTFGEDMNGEVYVADHRSVNGAVYRIVDVAPLLPRRRAVGR
ncbi:MAG TPA: PQQ-dependent sugar dehydrogenase [Thermoanaerobaculia bacterium]|nr:PQQ-dependent sugar dehydrogenase [Thermoanaerobaculia bacterium]